MYSKFGDEGETIDWIADAARTAGDIIQLPDGRAGQVTLSVASGELVAVRVKQGALLKSVAKAAGLVGLKGGPAWWDHSANAITPNEPIGSSDRDFYAGVFAEDAASADATCSLLLNLEPRYIIDSTRDYGDTAIVKTVVGSTTVEVPQVYNRGGMIFFQFGTTAEAQKVDWLSDRKFALASNWIVEILLELITAADNAAVDIDLGVGSGTNATDFESVAEFATFHLDGNDLNIDAQSDDGTTDKAPTDTNTDIVVGTPVRFVLDGRDHTRVKYYINGVEQLPSEANLGVLTAATGPLGAIIHAEKTADDSPLAFAARIRVRTQQ